ncbi:MliC family protein [Marinomonas pollencensis]|nr:MliC family protein [Marinomonas pollencensis]
MSTTKKWTSRLFAGVTLLGLTACSGMDTGPEDSYPSLENSQTDVADYLCTGMPLKVMFHGEKAHILWQQETYDLTRAISASGAYYLGEDVSFWVKGKRAGLEIDNLTKVKCQLIRVEA